jgi:hypothetical protein
VACPARGGLIDFDPQITTDVFTITRAGKRYCERHSGSSEADGENGTDAWLGTLDAGQAQQAALRHPRLLFRAYYSEIRKHVATHDPDFQVLPLWFKGGRKIQVQACGDGVIVVHCPFDEEMRSFPNHEDSNEFYLTPGMSVKEAVARMVPPRPGGEIQVTLLDYEPGEPFGAFSYREPIQLIHQMGEDQELVEEVKWTRLDAADMGCLDIWRDKSEAHKSARQVLSQYLPVD